ncbi:glycoside hydrolase family 92 protein [Dyadobacter sediminis]|uniref:glycoside hydrolase family 92 protein n=1 Tax=Dyadobacter sediminis TaxID=1493691 RepID=UPI0021CF2D3F|nr:glycoside hydrolase family 92 protein [Dyadobacter sediminis]
MCYSGRRFSVRLNQVCPGKNRFEIASPVFEKVAIRPGPAYARGRQFTIVAPDNSPVNIYIQSAKLNGKAYSKCFLDYTDITSGGTPEVTVGPHPMKILATDSCP